MPVPTLVTDLSTTLASNSPAGSDNVFPDLDNYLRALSGFVASIRDNSGNGWVSPYLPLTYSAGTANGVVYLNGSKVVTTGSALVFDGSNLGLGVTPSAWNIIKAIEIGGFRNSVFSDNGSVSVGIASGSYYNSGWKYALTGSTVGRYEIAGSSHQWFTAPSGTAGNAISFTQAMTLTSGGDLLVGTTTSAARLTVEGSALVAKFRRTSSGGIAQFQNGDDAGYGIDLLNVAGTSAGSIYWTATTTTYATSSDRRLKENVVAAPSASAAIDAIQIVSYDWKSAPNEPHIAYGVIAQDLHTVAPEAVSVGDDGDTVEKPWGVDYSKLVPMLIKEIQSLRARVAALEAA